MSNDDSDCFSAAATFKLSRKKAVVGNPQSLAITFGKAVTVESPSSTDFVAKNGCESLYHVFRVFAPEVSLPENKWCRLKGKISAPAFNKLMISYCGFATGRTRKKCIASSAGNWVFSNRRWLDPRCKNDKRMLEMNYDKIFALFPSFRLCSKAEFMDIMTENCEAWCERSEGRPVSKLQASPSAFPEMRQDLDFNLQYSYLDVQAFPPRAQFQLLPVPGQWNSTYSPFSVSEGEDSDGSFNENVPEHGSLSRTTISIESLNAGHGSFNDNVLGNGNLSRTTVCMEELNAGQALDHDLPQMMVDPSDIERFTFGDSSFETLLEAMSAT